MSLTNGTMPLPSALVSLNDKTIQVLTNKQRVEDLAANINYRHRMAQQAQRSSVQLNSILHIQEQAGTN